MSLYPTPTRLALLRDVADGSVWRHIHLRGEDWSRNKATGRRCTADMDRLRDAGWVEITPLARLDRPWRLTAAGRAVLEAGGAR